METLAATLLILTLKLFIEGWEITDMGIFRSSNTFPYKDLGMCNYRLELYGQGQWSLYIWSLGNNKAVKRIGIGLNLATDIEVIEFKDLPTLEEKKEETKPSLYKDDEEKDDISK